MTTETDLLPLPSGNVAHLIAAQAAEIEALRMEVSEWKRVASAQAELHSEAEARAERLAEALQLAEEHISAMTPECYRAGQRVLAAIRAALEQETKA